jgi:hypothetical protein
MQLNTVYQLLMCGTPAFPIWTVFKCYEDAKHNEVEHMAETVFTTSTKQQAIEFLNNL